MPAKQRLKLSLIAYRGLSPRPSIPVNLKAVKPVLENERNVDKECT